MHCAMGATCFPDTRRQNIQQSAVLLDRHPWEKREFCIDKGGEKDIINACDLSSGAHIFNWPCLNSIHLNMGFFIAASESGFSGAFRTLLDCLCRASIK